MYANLANADLEGASLGCARLHHANLSDANLHGAYLGEASLLGADVHGPSFAGAMYDLRTIWPDQELPQDIRATLGEPPSNAILGPRASNYPGGE
jgi:hypothetical protein